MTPETNIAERTTMVVGASRGLGRGIAQAFAQAGGPVIAVARSEAALSRLAGESEAVAFEVADATDPVVAGVLLDRHEPQILVLVAGASPLLRPLPQQTWETFSANWHTDVRLAFHWLREVLLKPLSPGSRVVVISSGAAIAGSPLSGGYAGAKATVRFITTYARDEASRAGLGISFTAVLPRLTPLTSLGRPAVKAYAARNAQTEEEYVAAAGPALTPEIAGAAIVEVAGTDADALAPEYLLTGAGLQTLG
jgi:NAD(P)-dependent dehydrogenase (short-subunit alcohol dehydrogenase family)